MLLLLLEYKNPLSTRYSRLGRATRRWRPQEPRATRMKDLLVCLLGSIRGGPQAWRSLIEHVIQPLHADLAILGPQTHAEQGELFRAARYVWADVPEHADWGEALDTFSPQLHDWREYAARNNRSGLWGPARLKPGADQLDGSGAIIFVLRMYLLERLAPVASHYRQLMVTRSDHHYVCNHPVLPVGSIWVPHGGDSNPPRGALREVGVPDGRFIRRWHCITERHVVLPSDIARQVLAVLPWLLTADWFHAQPLRQGRWPNPECAVGTYWGVAGVWRRLRRCARKGSNRHPDIATTSIRLRSVVPA